MSVLVMMAEVRSARVNPVWAEAVRIIERKGVGVDLGFLEDAGCWDVESLSRKYDLFILKSRAPAWVTLAGGLHARRSRILNPYPATLRVLNKFETSEFLRAAGFPLPRSWLPGKTCAVAGQAGLTLVQKPVFGHRGQGVRILSGPPDEGCESSAQQRRSSFVQEFVTAVAPEFKVKVAGKSAYAFIPKKSAASPFVEGEPCPLPPDVAEMVFRLGEALDLVMYGVDIIPTGRGPVVVDVNLIPSFRQRPEMAGVLAETILDALGEGPGPT